jgi:hypothetical protein
VALVHFDRVRDTATTTGTGVFTVSGSAPTGYRTFSAVMSVNDTFIGAIIHQSANEWEVGLYTYSASNQITRTTILASSNAGSAVSFSAGTKDVINTQSAARGVLMTDITVPKILGGAGAGSSLILQSTSGAGSSDFIAIKTGNSGIEGLRVDTNQDVIVRNNTQNLTGAWSSYNPTITAQSGSFTSANSTVYYWRCGFLGFLTGEFHVTTVGTATGDTRLSLPSGWNIDYEAIGECWDRGAGTKSEYFLNFDTNFSATQMILAKTASGLANGATFNFSGHLKLTTG